MIRSCACEADPIVFGHSACDRAPGWLIRRDLWTLHNQWAAVARAQWALQSRKELENA